MSALIKDVADYLEDEGVGTVGTSIFVGYTPEDIASCIAVIDTGGNQPDVDLPTYNPTFQVYIRDTDFVSGQAKLDAVRTALHRLQNQALVSGGTYCYYILANSQGGHLGRDEAGRDLFSINFRAHTR